MSGALNKLIEAVEAGLPSPMIWRDFATVPEGDPDNPGPILAHRAYYGSLDAAMELHETLLPGWTPGMQLHDNGLWFVELREGYCTSYSRVVLANLPDLARAWLLAILRAYAAQQEATP